MSLGYKIQVFFLISLINYDQKSCEYSSFLNLIKHYFNLILIFSRRLSLGFFDSNITNISLIKPVL